MTQKNTEVVLTTSQERGEPRRGEPCSWWQASEAKHLATMGATRGTVYTCGLARRWKQSHATRPGPMGVMTKFPCSDNLSTGWPSFNGTKEEHTGPLSSQCSCGKNHKSGLQEPTKKTATHAATCATTSTRKWSTEQVKGAWQLRAHFLILADAGSLTNFLLRQQPWLQALFQGLHEGPNTRKVQGEESRLNETRAGAEETKEKRGRIEEELEEVEGWSIARKKRKRKMLEPRESNVSGTRNETREAGGRIGKGRRSTIWRGATSEGVKRNRTEKRRSRSFREFRRKSSPGSAAQLFTCSASPA